MNNSFKLLMAATLLLLSLNIHAEQRGFYIGGSGGYSSADINKFSEDRMFDQKAAIDSAGNVLDLITSYSRIDDDDAGWKIFAGYNVNPYFGIELAYVNLGNIFQIKHITDPSKAEAAEYARDVGTGEGDKPTAGNLNAGRGQPDGNVNANDVLNINNDNPNNHVRDWNGDLAANFNDTLEEKKKYLARYKAAGNYFKSKATGFAIAGVIKYPVIKDKLDVFAKIGAFAWKTEGKKSLGTDKKYTARNEKLRDILAGKGVDLAGKGVDINDADDQGVDVLLGVGVKYNVMENIGIRAEWERFQIGSSHVNFLSLGVQAEFDVFK